MDNMCRGLNEDFWDTMTDSIMVQWLASTYYQVMDILDRVSQMSDIGGYCPIRQSDAREIKRDIEESAFIRRCELTDIGWYTTVYVRMGSYFLRELDRLVEYVDSRPFDCDWDCPAWDNLEDDMGGYVNDLVVRCREYYEMHDEEYAATGDADIG